jgi:uncharacterized membrane protein
MAVMIMQSLARIARSLVFNTQPENYESIAESWLITLFVIAAVLTGGMILYEWLLKHMHDRRHPWGKTKIIWLMLAAMGFTTLGVMAVYGYSEDFQTVVRFPGLFVGVFVSWVMSIAIFLLGHLIIPDFRRDLYGF